MSATAAALERAADLIVEHGWWDGGSSLAAARTHCALTAITAAAPKDMSRTLDEFRAYVGNSISAWNDSHRSGEPVVAALRACAAQLREAGK